MVPMLIWAPSEELVAGVAKADSLAAGSLAASVAKVGSFAAGAAKAGNFVAVAAKAGNFAAGATKLRVIWQIRAPVASEYVRYCLSWVLCPLLPFFEVSFCLMRFFAVLRVMTLFRVRGKNSRKASA